MHALLYQVTAVRRPLGCVALAKRKPPVHSNTTLRHPCAADAGQNPRPQTISTSDYGPVFKDFRRDRHIWFGNRPKLLKQVKLIASELRPLRMKQVASPGALKQVKLVASELRASPPKNEASGFARSPEASEASSFGASRFAPYE